MKNKKNTQRNNGSTIIQKGSIIVLFLVITVAIVLFGTVAYFYMNTPNESNTQEVNTVANVQKGGAGSSVQSGENADDYTVVREDGEVIHISKCPVEGTCGDPTKIPVFDKRYYGKVQTVTDSAVTILTNDGTTLTVKADETPTIKRVDYTKGGGPDIEEKEIAIKDIKKDEKIVVVFDGNSNKVKGVYVFIGNFR